MKRSARLLALTITLFATGVAFGQAPGSAKRLEEGDRARDFELPLVRGEGYVSLSDTYKQGPTVVVFLRGYPGYQCPACSRQVGSLVNRAKVLGQFAHRVILVYPGKESDLDRHAKQFLSGRRLPDLMRLVRDDNLNVVEEWGLRWDSPRETAYPATYVIDPYGRVAWGKVSKTHSGRSSVEEILKALRKL